MRAGSVCDKVRDELCFTADGVIYSECLGWKLSEITEMERFGTARGDQILWQCARVGQCCVADQDRGRSENLFNFAPARPMDISGILADDGSGSTECFLSCGLVRVSDLLLLARACHSSCVLVNAKYLFANLLAVCGWAIPFSGHAFKHLFYCSSLDKYCMWKCGYLSS